MLKRQRTRGFIIVEIPKCPIVLFFLSIVTFCFSQENEKWKFFVWDEG